MLDYFLSAAVQVALAGLVTTECRMVFLHASAVLTDRLKATLDDQLTCRVAWRAIRHEAIADLRYGCLH